MRNLLTKKYFLVNFFKLYKVSLKLSCLPILKIKYKLFSEINFFLDKTGTKKAKERMTIALCSNLNNENYWRTWLPIPV